MKVLAIAAAAEGLTGLALLASPDLVARLLLGAELDTGGMVMSRFAGLALICFALACWPRCSAPASSARSAMLVFQPAMALALAVITLTTGLAGILLWPAVLYHAAASYLVWQCS